MYEYCYYVIPILFLFPLSPPCSPNSLSASGSLLIKLLINIIIKISIHKHKLLSLLGVAYMCIY